MISKQEAQREFSRLSEIDGYHLLTPEAIADYLCAIQVAETVAIAQRVIEDVKADELREDFPSSPSIRRAMYEENERGRPSAALADLERWRAEAELDPHPLGRMTSRKGIWAPGRWPDLDRHLDLLEQWIQAGAKITPELRAKLRAETERLRQD